MSRTTTSEADLTPVANAVRAHERFVVTTHENPDGDALGSLLATKLTIEELTVWSGPHAKPAGEKVPSCSKPTASRTGSP